MIDRAMTFLAAHLRDVLGLAAGEPALRGAREITGASAPPGVSLSLVNVGEERTLRNLPHTERTPTETRRIEPPVHVNLDVLIAFHMADYDTSLGHLSRTIEAFQTRRFFDAGTHPAAAAAPFPAGLDRIILEMRNLSLSDLTDLWSTLGGACLPSLLYRVRLIEIQGATAQPTDRIDTIDVTARNTATASP